MTKHFCVICKKEIPKGSFLAHDVLFTMDELDIEILVMRAPNKKFIMVCEECVTKKISEYFVKKVEKG